MPTFQQAIDANPSEFMTYGATLARAAGELTSLTAQYSQQVAALGSGWQGEEYQGLLRWAAKVAAFTAQNNAVLMTSSAALASMGATMMATVQTMKITKQSAEGIGYRVLPMPMVILGPSQWSQVSSAGPAAPAVLAAYQAGAAAFSAALGAQYAALVAQDTAASATLRAALAIG